MDLTLFQTQFGSNTLSAYFYAFGAFVGSLIILQIVKVVIIAKLHVLAKSTNTKWDDLVIKALQSLGWLFYFSIALYVSTQFVQLQPFVTTIIRTITLVSVTYYIVVAIQLFIKLSLDNILKRATGEAPDSTILGFLENAIRISLWVSAIILILQNLGYRVSALLGGLGIAGIAIAFSLQNILEDIFSFFSIYFDKPFQKGDFIIVGKDKGTVEHIGMKTTRIKSIQGEEIIISNKELTQSRVNNFRTMERRRVSFKFGILYETPRAKVKKVPTLVKTALSHQKLAEFDRAHFTQLGDSSLNFEVVYFINSKEISDYKNIQQAINLELMEAFEKEGIAFAYPTRTIYMKK